MKPTVIVLKDRFPAVLEAVMGLVLLQAAFAGGHVIEGAAKINASAGRPGLQIKTGALVGSINVSTSKVTRGFAQVDVGPSVLYARIHEFGGIIVPTSKSMLSWVNDAGERVFANAVHIPARPYMRPAVDENKSQIGWAVEASIDRGIRAVL